MNDQTAPERPRTLVLASTSRYRRALLDRLGLPFVVASPPYQEEQELPLTPPALVVELARRKAESVAPLHPDALILGCDQVAALGDDILGKPGTRERAVEQLMQLAGRTHRLLTGVALLDARTGETVTAISMHEMTMRPFARSEAERYVEMDAPVDCAGAYKVESLGVALFESMSGDDHTGIIGLPLTRVVTLLGRHGIHVLQQ
jgi:septum formation protein